MTRMRRRFGLWAVGLLVLVAGSAGGALVAGTQPADAYLGCINLYNYTDENTDTYHSGYLCMDGFFEFVL